MKRSRINRSRGVVLAALTFCLALPAGPAPALPAGTGPRAEEATTETVALPAGPAVHARAAGPDTPYLRLNEGRSLETVVSGPARQAPALASGRATPRALASADFDEDGVPDLVAGYAADAAGLVVLHRGTGDLSHPYSLDARRRRAAGDPVRPFLTEASGFALPSAPDLLVAGDFDADGHADLASAARDAHALVWLSGDGRGGFGPARPVGLPGAVTAIAAGEVNRPDGLADLAVGLRTDEGARVLVFEGPTGALRAEPETLDAPAEVSEMVFGRFDAGAEADLAVAAGTHVVVVRGRDRRLSADAPLRAEVPPARVAIEDVGVAVRSIAAAGLTRDGREEIAVLGEDGAIRRLERAGATWTAVAMTGERWPGGGRLVRANASSLPDGDLAVLEANRIHVVASGPEARRTAEVLGTLEVDGGVEAVLPIRLNEDGLADLVVLGRSNVTPSYVTTAPAGSYVVTNTNTTGPGSIGQAIADANANPGADTIAFSIAGSGPHVINLAGPGSFALDDTVTIDATTEPDYAGVPVVVLNGPGGSQGGAFSLNASGSVIRGFTIQDFGAGTSIVVSGSNNTIEASFFGTDTTGTSAVPNATGIRMVRVAGRFPSNNVVGGTTAAARNVISGNQTGVHLESGSGNAVRGNLIGTNVSGTGPLGNTSTGIVVTNSGAGLDGTVIGGTAAGSRNVISANADGVRILLSALGTLVQGNYIGTDAGGAADLGNTQNGIEGLDGTPTYTIGGTTPAARNVISGNDGDGVALAGAGNAVQGNYIGTNAAGTAAVGNSDNGVRISETGSALGGAVAGAGNVVSGNLGTGIFITGTSATIQGNAIGTNAAGTAAIPNGVDGMQVNGGNGGPHTIGGTGDARNIVSGNTRHGMLFDLAQGGTVRGNLVGTAGDGVSPLPNAGTGIFLARASNVAVGGLGAGEGNVIHFNGGDGVTLSEFDAPSNPVRGNSIHANAGLGIDYSNNGVTANDSCDGDITRQNFPVLTSASSAGGATTVNGTLNSTASTLFTIDFYSNSACDALGNGEGRTYLGSTTTTTNASCQASFTANLPVAVPTGEVVVATAVAPNGETSEFSACAQVNDTAPNGRDTVAIYLPSSGSWFERNSNSSGGADLVFGYGPSNLGWVALRGDWNGDGVDTPGLYDPSSGFFFLRNSNSPGGADLVFSFGPGGQGFVPLTGDFDGDGVDTIGFYVPSNGFFFLKNTNAGGAADLVFGFGPGGSFVPLVGDYNGDDVDTVGIYDPSTGFFFLRNSNSPGGADLVFSFGPGGQGFVPLLADYDGDGDDTVGLYSPSNGFFFLRNTNAPGGADLVFGYGPAGAIPLVGDWNGQ